jgi:endonuclease/exonuclease/phosphatase family metal-dependent hydrolase
MQHYPFLKLASATLVSFLVGACAFEEPDAANLESSEVAQGLDVAPLTVMSLNVRIPNDDGDRSWAKRLPRLQRTVQYWSPDVIGIQELKVDTDQQLLSALPGYQRTWVKRADGEMIALYWKATRFDYGWHEFRAVAPAERRQSCGSDVGQYDSNIRSVQLVYLYDKLTNKPWYFYNTHFPSKNSCERHGMADAVAAYVAQRPDRTAGVVMLGDMNDGYEPDGRLNLSYAKLLNKTGFRSAYAVAGDSPLNAQGQFITANTDWSKSARVGRMIDHVLVSLPRERVRWATVDRSMFKADGSRVTCRTVVNGKCNNIDVNSLSLYSDHWAVVASIVP